MQSTTVRDRQEYINEKGNKSVKYVVNAQETMIARAKQQQIQEAFASWVWKEPERRDRLLRIYNETFNTVRPREFEDVYKRQDQHGPKSVLCAGRDGQEGLGS